MTTKQFHIGDVLTITDGHLVSPRHIAGAYDILGFMTNSSPFTHQLPRLADECKPSLVAQHPNLASIVIPDGLDTEEKVINFLAPLIAEHGEFFDVEPLAEGEHTTIDPIAEIKMMRPDMPIIVVGTDENGDVEIGEIP